MALNNLLSKKMENPYFRPPPLTVAVLQLSTKPKIINWDFSKNVVQPGLTKLNTLAIITDGITLTKLTIFEQFGSKIKLGQTYIMRRYSLRGTDPPYYVSVDGKTKFFHTTDLSVTDDLRKEAELLSNPPSPLTPISESQSRRGLQTIEGQVMEASFFLLLLVLR